MRRLILLGLLLALAGRSEAAAPDAPAPAQIPAETPDVAVTSSRSTFNAGLGTKPCYVWFEVNAQSSFDPWAAQAESWDDIGYLVITGRQATIEAITTQAVITYTVSVTGFKGSDFFNGGATAIEDETAWANIATLANTLSAIIDDGPVILEMEGALSNWAAAGNTTIDGTRLFNSIAAQSWPEIWVWYCSSDATNATAWNRAFKYGMPNARLIEKDSAGLTGDPASSTKQAQLGVCMQTEHDPISIVYPGDDAGTWWDMADTDLGIKDAAGREVILYPRWANLAEHAAMDSSACE